MKKLFFLFFFSLLILPLSIMAQKGYVTLFMPDQADTLMISLIRIHYGLESKLPIEIWYRQEEMDEESRQRFSQFDFVELRPVSQGKERSLLRILERSYFSEIIWFLPNISFITSAEVIFDNPGYKNTGIFLFQDSIKLQKKRKKERKQASKENQELFNRLTQELASFLPLVPYDIDQRLNAQRERFSEKYKPIFTYPGLMIFHRDRHLEGLERSIVYSQDPIFSRLFDIDLLWLGIITSGKPIHLNFEKKAYLTKVRPDPSDNEINKVTADVQLYRGKTLVAKSDNHISSFLEEASIQEGYELVNFNCKIARPLLKEEKKGCRELIQAPNLLIERLGKQ